MGNVEKACAAVGRNLAGAEWAQYFGARPRERTCSQWALEAER